MNQVTIRLLRANARMCRRRSREASKRELSGLEPIGKIIPAVLSDIQSRVKSKVLV